MVPNIVSIIIAVFPHTFKIEYYLQCTMQKVPDNSVVHKSLQNYCSSVWNLLHVIFLVQVEVAGSLFSFWKICGLLN